MPCVLAFATAVPAVIAPATREVARVGRDVGTDWRPVFTAAAQEVA
jgi:hypothetical protein